MLNLLMLSGLHIFTLMLKIMKKILNLKFAFIFEHQNKKKKLSEKVINQIGQKFLLLKKLNILYHGCM